MGKEIEKIGMQNGKKIIIDIDNTLWDLSPELWNHLREVNPDMPPPSQWNRWDSWEGHVPLRDLMRALRTIHMNQERYSPYPESEFFLNGLKERDFYIIIASHRHKEALEPTVHWLKKHRLIFDEVHLSYDKSVLFNHCAGIVDDNPRVLEKAEEAGIVRAGLLNPWNEDTHHPLFKNLIEVLDFLDSQFGYVAKISRKKSFLS